MPKAETPIVAPEKVTTGGGDNPCKFLAERYPEQLVRWLFGVRGVPVALVKAELSRAPARADSAILLQSTNELFHVEFQTTARSHAPLDWRMLDYYVGFRRVFPAARIRQALVVLHDIGEAIPAGYESPTLSFRYQVVKLWERDARELLAHDGLLSLAVLCRTEDNNERLLETVAKRINRLAETPERREQMNLARTLVGLRFKAMDIYRLLQGGDMLEESVIYQDIARQGWQKGRHEGRAEGLQEGALLGERQLLISQLTYKFGNLSAATRKQLGRLALPQVEELGRAMLFFQTKAELLAWLRTHATSQ